jgi:siroheme synthase
MRADMPLAVVTAACCDDQEILRLTLDRLGVQPVRNPTTIVIGEVAAGDVMRDVVANASVVAEFAAVAVPIS